jgi:hypothetical protein
MIWVATFCAVRDGVQKNGTNLQKQRLPDLNGRFCGF